MGNTPLCVGNNDASISNGQKIWIMQSGVLPAVCGLIGPGTTMQVTSNYQDPFAQTSLGSMFEKSGGVLQGLTGATSKTTLNSALVWQGNEATSFSVVMIFCATEDAYREVMLPLHYLELWQAPDINANSPINIGAMFSGEKMFGRVPNPITLNIAGRLIINNCLLVDVTMPLDKERDKDGNLIRVEVTLQIKTQRMQSLGDVKGRTGL